jgi:hypothetical protein
MHRHSVAIVGMALLGLMACSSDIGTRPITGPTSLATAAGGQSQPNYTFAASLKGTTGASQWHGDTQPNTVPTTGHPGHVTMNLSDPLTWGATLSWAGMHHGSKAVCTISNDVDTTVLTVDCGAKGSGSLDVYPVRTTTYRFKNKENADNSQDPWQIAETTVAIITTLSSTVGVKWEPKAGYDKDDPVSMYTGKASGALDSPQIDADGPQRCGLGGGTTYTHFHATMTFVPPATSTAPPTWNATYTANTDAANGCGAAAGRVTLTPDLQ